tara:strand:- start:5 stop:268 length:264 start_codon:yes stop_codon:yes gene_type:complete
LTRGRAATNLVTSGRDRPQTKGKREKMNIYLTNKDISALLWAIDLTEGSFAGWSKEEIGSETVADLLALKRLFAKLLEQSDFVTGAY